MAFAQILYISRCVILPDKRKREQDAILRSARRFNETRDVTGCLAFRGGWFFQVIEGSREAVDSVMVRISRDRRHSDIAIRMRREVGTRSFPHWRMAEIELDEWSLPGGDASNLPAVVLLAELIRLSEQRVSA